MRPEGQHSEEDQVADQRAGADLDLIAEVLGDTEHDAAEQGSPQRPQPTDDDGLEREQEGNPPVIGVNVVRAPRKNPARATAANAIAIATPYRCLWLMPISSAVCGSSAVARNARPIWVNVRKSWSEASTTIATMRMIRGNHPIDRRR